MLTRGVKVKSTVIVMYTTPNQPICVIAVFKISIRTRDTIKYRDVDN